MSEAPHRPGPALPSAAALLEPVVPVLRAHAAAHDAEATFPVRSVDALREHRLMGLLVPREYGGIGADLATYVEVCGGLAAHCLSTAQIWAMHCFQVDAVVRHGSPGLKARLLPRIAAGEVYIASVTSEQGRRADLFTAATPLKEEGDRLLLDRNAPVVTGGAHADGYLITMRASPEARENEVSFVYADRGDLHMEVTGPWDAMGMRATESVGMVLRGSVPADQVIGGPGKFAEVAHESMVPISHLGWSACWLGTARGALDDLTRSGLKSGGPARRKNAAAHSDLFYERIGQIRMRLELVSAYLTRVRQEIEDARHRGASLNSPAYQLQLNVLKIAASDLTYRAVDGMVQLAGLRTGYLRDSAVPLERHLRDLRSAGLNHGNDQLRVGVGALSMLDRGVSLI